MARDRPYRQNLVKIKIVVVWNWNFSVNLSWNAPPVLSLTVRSHDCCCLAEYRPKVLRVLTTGQSRSTPLTGFTWPSGGPCNRSQLEPGFSATGFQHSTNWATGWIGTCILWQNPLCVCDEITSVTLSLCSGSSQWMTGRFMVYRRRVYTDTYLHRALFCPGVDFDISWCFSLQDTLEYTIVDILGWALFFSFWYLQSSELWLLRYSPGQGPI